MTACSSCGCEKGGRHPKRRAAILTDCFPATCWQWDHACYAKRMSKRGRRGSTGSSYAPAMMGGKVVPNVTLAA